MSQQQPAARSKQKGGGKKRGGANRGAQAAQDGLGLSEQQAGHLTRITRLDQRKADNSEDPGVVQLSKLGKAAQLVLSEDRMSVTGSKGFRTARASHGVHEGTWYAEATVTHLGATGHARLGWCTKKAELQAPVGFDIYGYCYRDLEGTRVHDGNREPYGQPFAEGDVIGMLLHLPPGGRPMETADRMIARFKGSLYYVEEPEQKPKTLPGSCLAFSVNGVSQGPAFTDILEGTYYPAASLYTLPSQAEGATVTFNFGPSFKHGPPAVEGISPARPMSEAISVVAAAPVLGAKAIAKAAAAGAAEAAAAVVQGGAGAEAGAAAAAGGGEVGAADKGAEGEGKELANA